MKTFYLIVTLLAGTITFAQSGRYILHLDNSQQAEKAFVKDFGDHQLTGGINNPFNGVYWIAKMDDETVIWAKSFPAPATWAPMDITPFEVVEYANGDILFVAKNQGSMGGSAKIVKLDASGNLIWGRELIAQEDYPQWVYENNPIIVEDDGVIISMSGENDLLVAKLNNLGSLTYSKQLKMVSPDGGDCPGHLFIPNNSGGYFAGFEAGGSATVVSLDASFNVIWSNRIVTEDLVGARSLCQTANGNLFVGGTGENPYEAFLSQLSSTGDIQSYRKFNDSLIYSVDQIFDFNDTTLLANTRLGYAFVNKNDWTYDEMGSIYSGFNSLRKSSNGWTISNPWGMEYFLNVDLNAPQCMDYETKTNKSTTPLTATAEAITCNVNDLGSLIVFSPQLTDITATVTKDCFLSVPEESLNNLVVYPNPVQSGSVLSFSEDIKDATIALTDLQGKTITEAAFSQHMTIPGLTAGIYLVKIIDKKGTIATRRIVVE